jgi:hypothetical protein
MSMYLIINGWEGSRRVPINVIEETPEGLRIAPLETIFLPGRGLVKPSQSVLVLKQIVRPA